MISISETVNPIVTNTKPIKERMGVLIPGMIDKNIPNRNGSIVCLCGSGGSGKSSLLLNWFRNKNYYRNKFHNVFYIVHEASFSSVVNSPFKAHDKVYHDLTVELIEEISEKLEGMKLESEDEDEDSIQYSALIIDDFANKLKDKFIERALNQLFIKTRHLCLSIFITVQAFMYLPKQLRRQIGYAIIFKPKNTEEFTVVAKELVHMNQQNASTLFDYVFDQNYNYLGIDTVTGAYYKNNNQLTIHN